MWIPVYCDDKLIFYSGNPGDRNSGYIIFEQQCYMIREVKVKGNDVSFDVIPIKDIRNEEAIRKNTSTT